MFGISLRKNKLMAAFIGMFLLLAGTAFASGTGDALGLASTWADVQGWFADPAVTGIIGFLILIFAVFLFLQKMIISGIFALVMIVVVMNLTTVAASFAGAGLL